MPAKIRRLYFEPLKGKYHALFIGQNIKSFYTEGEFSSPVDIEHLQDSVNLLIEVFDKDGTQVFVDRVTIIDRDNVRVEFLEDFVGKIHLIIF